MSKFGQRLCVVGPISRTCQSALFLVLVRLPDDLQIHSYWLEPLHVYPSLVCNHYAPLCASTHSHFAMSTANLGVEESFSQRMLETTMDINYPA